MNKFFALIPALVVVAILSMGTPRPAPAQLAANTPGTGTVWGGKVGETGAPVYVYKRSNDTNWSALGGGIGTVAGWAIGGPAGGAAGGAAGAIAGSLYGSANPPPAPGVPAGQPIPVTRDKDGNVVFYPGTAPTAPAPATPTGPAISDGPAGGPGSVYGGKLKKQ